MSEDDTRVVQAKKQITANLILELYDEMLEIEDEEQRKGMKAAIDVLSENIGCWLTVDVDKDDQ